MVEVPSLVVRVSRDPDDARTVLVPADELRNPQMTVVCSGDRRVLEAPVVQAYMWCSLIAGAPFGHTCGHKAGNGPDGAHSIGVIVHQDGSDPIAYAQLRHLAVRNRGGRRRRGQRLAEQARRAQRGDRGDGADPQAGAA